MNEPDTKLDQQLTDADRCLLRPGTPSPAGDVIRRRAEQRQTARQQRRRALAGVAAMVLLLAGWRLLMPTNRMNPVAVLDPELTVEELQTEMAQLRQQQEVLDIQLSLLQSKTTLGQFEFQLNRFAKTDRSAQAIFQRNRNTWKVLQHVAADLPESSVRGSDRWQLELLASGFPDTEAGAIAQTILSTNKVPDFLNEQSNEF